MLPALAKMSKVAPLAGSVDRNLRVHHHLQQRLVAPLAGSVDRNDDAPNQSQILQASLPSRGAWIEICTSPGPTRAPCVAPLAGSVDRNPNVMPEVVTVKGRSPRGERG